MGRPFKITVMNREPLDIYDELPEDMKAHLRYNGRYFNRRLLEFAVGNMTTATGHIQPITKEELRQMFTKYGITINNESTTIYDLLFAANMCKADYLGSSIADNEHLCKYVKDVADDPDGYEGLIFNRWYADCCRKGIGIDWYEYR